MKLMSINFEFYFAGSNFAITSLKIDEFSKFLNVLTAHQLGFTLVCVTRLHSIRVKS